MGTERAGSQRSADPPGSVRVVDPRSGIAVQDPPPTENTPHVGRDYPDRDPQLFYELAKDRLATQLGIIDAVNNKIGLLVSLASALMGILVAVFALRANAFGAAEYAVISISGLLYLIVATTSAYAYFSRSWEIGPGLRQIWDSLWNPSEDDNLLKWKVARDFWGNYEKNLPTQNLKATLLPWILLGVIAQTLTLAAALGLVAAGT